MGFEYSLNMFYFDAAAIVILIVLFLLTLFNYGSNNNRVKIFYVLMLLAVVASITDYLSFQKALGYAGLMIVNSIYFMVRLGIAVVFLVYALELDHHWNYVRNKPFQLLLTFAPYVVLIILLITNVWTNYLFIIDQDLVYQRGSGLLVLYICAFVYIALAMFFLFRSKKFYSKTQIFAGVICCFIQIIGIIIQIRFYILVEVFSTAVSLMLLLTFVEMPDNFVEYKTNLPNGNAYNEYIRHRSELKKSFFVTLVYIGNYSEIFNIFDYKTAKELLATTSKQILNISRRLDPKSEVFYLGQGSFAICFRLSDDLKTSIAEKLQNYLTTEIANSEGFVFTTKICIVDYPTDFDNSDDLIAFSNSFYNIVNFSTDIVEVAKLKNNQTFNIMTKLDSVLDEAIKNRLFTMHYQPIYSVKDKKYMSCEALVRLDIKEYGNVTPALFIPYAEKTGKMKAIGDIILEKIFEFMGSPKFKALNIETVEINLSISQCIDPDLYESVKQKLDKYGIDPKSFIFEITESEQITENKMIMQNIHRLNELGIAFSLDDYGTAYSNITRIGQLPITMVKIDKSLVDNIHIERFNILLRNTFRMLDELGIDILCEGVEDQKTLDATISIGVDYVQGFYYSKALTEEEFIKFMENKIGDF